jgi:hypothetical protein
MDTHGTNHTIDTDTNDTCNDFPSDDGAHLFAHMPRPTVAFLTAPRINDYVTHRSPRPLSEVGSLRLIMTRRDTPHDHRFYNLQCH